MFHFFSSRFGNPTENFDSIERLDDIVLDVTDGSLNGVRLGANVGALRCFGRADDALGTEAEFTLEYARLGTCVSVSNEVVTSFELFLDAVFVGMHPIKFVPRDSVNIRQAGGQVARLDRSSSPDLLESVLGDVTHFDSADYTFGVENVYFYRVGANRLIASFDANTGALIQLQLDALPNPSAG